MFYVYFSITSDVVDLFVFKNILCFMFIRVLNERINKLENDIRSDLVEIKDSFKLINEHMLNCNKRIG